MNPKASSSITPGSEDETLPGAGEAPKGEADVERTTPLGALQGEGASRLGTVATSKGSTGRGRRRGSTFSPNEVVSNRYRVVQFIAEGGMGEVYEVEDLELHERVALKTVRSDVAAPETMERFRREIQLARRVTHPNVCRIFDLGRHSFPEEEGGSAIDFLTMELLSGQTLGERIRSRGKLRPDEALPIVRQIAAGLEVAHDAGIVHRDFKSSNVILVPGPRGERAVITDFGLARSDRGGEDAANLTTTGDVLGTPSYMAPEQVEGKRVGTPADIYAVGVVLFEMVTGVLPFSGSTAMAVALERLKREAPTARTRVPDLDPRWDAAIARCLTREPEKRIASAGELVAALTAADAPKQARARLGRREVGTAIGVGAILLVAGSVFFLRHQPAAPSGAKTSRRQVAVLGFRNLGSPESGWISTALAEMLRTELSAGQAVRTVPAGDLARVKLELGLAETDELRSDDLRKLGVSTGADTVVLGSYLALGKDAGGKLRLDLRVQAVETGEVTPLPAAEGNESELFAIVSKTGGELRKRFGLEALSKDLGREVAATIPAGSNAARFYSEGLRKLQLFDARAAKDLLERSIELDPEHALAHAALAEAWSALGYDLKARAEAKRAAELAQTLTREDALLVEARAEETNANWSKAIELYRSLLVFSPDRVDLALRLVDAEIASGAPKAALETLAGLRGRTGEGSSDPRFDLAEASAAKALTDFERQKKAAREAAKKAKAFGARLLFARARLSEGMALADLGDLAGARAACDEAATIFEAAGDQASRMRAVNTSATTYARAGDLAEAERLFSSALETYRKIGDQRGAIAQLGNLSSVAAEKGDLPRARDLTKQALEVAREVGDRAKTAQTLNNLGALLVERKEFGAARAALEEAVGLFREMGVARYEADALRNLGEAFLGERKYADAAGAFSKAETILRTQPAGEDLAAVLELSGEVESSRGDLARAKGCFEESAGLFEKADLPDDARRALGRLAALLRKGGDEAGARRAEARAAEAAKKPRSAS